MRRVVIVLLVSGCSFSPARVASDANGPAGNADGPGVGSDAPGSEIQVTFGERSTADHKTVTRDTYVDSFFPAVLHGGLGEALLDGNPESVMLLRFDLAVLAPSVVVTGAQLAVFTAGVQNNPGFIVTETTSAWSNNELWPGPTRDSSSLGGPASVTDDTEFTVSLPVTLINRWIATPASNHGLALTSGTTNDVFIRTSENSAIASRPLLTVTFVP